MGREELEAKYRDYIAALNETRWQDAAGFYQDRVRYNEHAFSRDEFRDQVLRITETVAPDTQIEIKSLVVEGDTLAVRLVRTGTAVGEWMGLKPTGQPISLGEHAFYRLRDGRCEEVWSIVDIAPLLAAAAAAAA